MTNLAKPIALTVALTLSTGSGLAAQEATERYIPVGQSPGVSGIYTDLGTVSEVDQEGRTITVQHEGGSRTIRVTPDTRIWLDRSRLRQVNSVGTFSDLGVGRTVEIRYQDRDTREVADWIKVVIEGA